MAGDLTQIADSQSESSMIFISLSSGAKNEQLSCLTST